MFGGFSTGFQGSFRSNASFGRDVLPEETLSGTRSFPHQKDDSSDLALQQGL